MKIFGIEIDDLSREDIISRIREFLEESRFHRIATVNPEFLLRAEKDGAFRRALLDADLRIADGFGIVLAGLFQGKFIHRFPGADLIDEVLHIAEKNNLGVYLAIRKDGLSSYEEIKAVLQKEYSRLIIDGADIDPKYSESYKLQATSYKLVLCNFGAPEQEIFLDGLKDQDGIRLAMGVGGSLDYLTGRQKRAPKLLRTLGLEWLWRLILQPKRWRRIWNATIVFPLKIIGNVKPPR
ncbi:MAG: WecB/TagA/CpsF family glycosyltransferase [Patescibacteria group bacterium]